MQYLNLDICVMPRVRYLCVILDRLHTSVAFKFKYLFSTRALVFEQYSRLILLNMSGNLVQYSKN